MIKVLSVLGIAAQACLAASPMVSSASWVGADGLGRKLPEYSETGPVRSGKYVGLFYWTWHGAFAANEARNITEILAAHPEALDQMDNPAWGPEDSPHFWGEPLFGYYNTAKDKWVLRKHARMLADAGVDVLFFDCTNPPFTWKESYDVLLDVFAQARLDGVRTPQVAFFMSFGSADPAKQALRNLYQDLYQPGRHQDLWFQWKGKPLILCPPESAPDIPGDTAGTRLNREIRNFFTFRPGQPAYASGPQRKDDWGWLEIFPQHGYAPQADGTFEEATVGVAQNWNRALGLAAMDAPNTFGRSYTDARGQDPRPAAVLEGLNFAEQWTRALQLDPQLLFITGWNEWVAGRAAEWSGRKPNAFPDEFSEEKSRDIEPMRGGHGDNYYMQMAANIRRFKGLPPPTPASAPHAIALDGGFQDWQDVGPEYRQSPGNAPARDFDGYVGRHYLAPAGRNDFTVAKVARDADKVYFYVETADPISPATDSAWMRLFIDLDRNHATGWEGYDLAVNRVNPQGTSAVVERNVSGQWKWAEAGQAVFQVKGNRMEIGVPWELLGAPVGGALDFEFKWSDGMRSEGDILDFYRNGTVSPSGRFNFLYKSEAFTSVRPHMQGGPSEPARARLRIHLSGFQDGIPGDAVEGRPANRLPTYSLEGKRGDSPAQSSGLYIQAPKARP